DRGFRVSECSKAGFTPDGRPCSKALALVTILERRLESVAGVSASWFSPTVRGVIRTEAEAFVDELAFIPEKNLNPRGQVPGDKPGSNGQFFVTCQKVNPKAFEDQYKFDNQFMQVSLQTDYLHGKLEPRLVAILDVSGIFAFNPSLVYRLTDNVLLSADYVAIEISRRAGLGTFRGHDILQFKVQAQLN